MHRSCYTDPKDWLADSNVQAALQFEVHSAKCALSWLCLLIFWPCNTSAKFVWCVHWKWGAECPGIRRKLLLHVPGKAPEHNCTSACLQRKLLLMMLKRNSLGPDRLSNADVWRLQVNICCLYETQASVPCGCQAHCQTVKLPTVFATTGTGPYWEVCSKPGVGYEAFCCCCGVCKCDTTIFHYHESAPVEDIWFSEGLRAVNKLLWKYLMHSQPSGCPYPKPSCKEAKVACTAPHSWHAAKSGDLILDATAKLLRDYDDIAPCWAVLDQQAMNHLTCDTLGIGNQSESE